jgi:N-acyl homoserine lactone hydrolase
MKVHVEAKPLHEPLAGGTRGATVSVEPIVAGQARWSRHLMESPGGRLIGLKLTRALMTGEPAVAVPCPAFLVRHPSAGAIMVDTGLHPSASRASTPAQTFPRNCASAGWTPARSRSS